MLPAAEIRKVDGQMGVVKPGIEGILAIIAPAEKGPRNQPASYTRSDLAFADFGHGPLVEYGSYVMSVARNPVLLIAPTTSIAAAYGAVNVTTPGTSAVTAGTTAPLDDYDVLVSFLSSGTVGTAGITYTESLDGGRTRSAVKALGTLTEIAVPSSGVTFKLGAGTIAASQSVACRTAGPQMSNADLVAALEALRVTAAPWDAVLIDGPATAATVATLDLWLSTREGEGRFRTAICNARPRNANESEASYRDALQGVFASAASIRVLVGADAGDMVSVVRGITFRRPMALGLAARGMAIDISTDAAYVGDGPIPGFQITDERDNPKYHNESLFPGLDDIRLSTFRSFDGREGVYITNPLLISASGSDYVYWQHARCMNKACEIAHQLLTGRLSQGIQKDNKTGYILESEAQDLESLVQAELDKQLTTPRRVSGAACIVSRTDDLRSNAGATITADVEVSSLAYVKKFAVTAKFVRTLTVSAT